MDRLYSVIAVTGVTGALQERIRYSAYGAPTALDEGTAIAKGDLNRDGAVTFADLNLYSNGSGAQLSSASSLYAPELDVDASGTVDFADFNRVLSSFGQSYTYRWENKQSLQTVGNTVGYCGYLADPATGLNLARYRWQDPSLGRWVSRDPIGYPDGMNFYEYVGGMPLCFVDPLGLSAWGDLWDNLKGVPKEIPGVIRDWYRNPGKNLRDAEDGYNSLPDTVKRGIDLLPGGGGVQVVCAINNPTPGNVLRGALSMAPGGGLLKSAKPLIIRYPSRRAAFRGAKDAAGVPRSAQPSAVRPSRNRDGTPSRDGRREYDFGPTTIREDGPHSYGPPGTPGNIDFPHFNVAPEPAGGPHFAYPP